MGPSPQAAPGRARAGRRRPLPVIGHIIASWRLLRDPKASWWLKLLLIGAVVYVLFPVDLLPDVVPFLGWLDDLGVIGLTAALLAGKLSPYLEPAQEVIDTEGSEAP